MRFQIPDSTFQARARLPWNLESGIWNRAGPGGFCCRHGRTGPALEARLEAFEGRYRILNSGRPLGNEALPELDRAAVIGVAVVGIGSQEEARFLAPDDLDQRELVLAALAKAAVAEVENLAELRPEDLGAAPGLALARRGVPARPHLAARQVHDPEPAAPRLEHHERAGAGELDVVGMRRDGEDVNRHECSPLPPAGRRPCGRSSRPVSRTPPARPHESPSGRPDRTRGAARAGDTASRRESPPGEASSPASASSSPPSRPFARPPSGSVRSTARLDTRSCAPRFRARRRASGRADAGRARENPVSPGCRWRCARGLPPRGSRPARGAPAAGVATPRSRELPRPGARAGRSGPDESGAGEREERGQRPERGRAPAHGRRSPTRRARWPRPVSGKT